MNIPWASAGAFKFVTNVGLITSDGPHGPNIMSAEWTHQVSYNPGLIAVCLGPNKATTENIQKAKKFGVNIAAVDQNVIASVSGGSTGKEVNKISALKELGFTFYTGKNGLLLVEGAALNAECKLFQEIPLGDHSMFVGEVTELNITKKEPLAYHQGKYWKLTETIPKPSDKERERMMKIVEKYRKK